MPNHSAHQTGATKFRPNLNVVINEYAVWFLECEVGATSFYECVDEKRCQSNQAHDGSDGKSKLPKGWYVYGCTESSMWVGKKQRTETNVCRDACMSGEYLCDCDGEIQV